MHTNSHKQHSNHLKDVYEVLLHTYVLKHCASDQEPHVTPRILRLLQFVKVTVTTFTKTAISYSGIIAQRCSCALSTRLKMFYTTSNLRTTVDGVASIYRGSLQCFGTALVNYLEIELKFY